MFYSPTPNRRKSWYRLLSIGQKKLIIIGFFMGVLLAVFIGILSIYAYRAMQYDLDKVSQGLGSSVLYDSENSPMASLSENTPSFASRDELPRHLVNAFVAREDEKFFEHSGVVFTSVLRSVVRNIMSMRYEQGASTITMQLTRNVYELSGKSMDRKLLETMLAQRIERRFDKYTILEQYLSRIFYGQNCYGIKAAARHYFGKEVKELDLVESATLAGLVRAPSLFNPVRSMENAMEVKAETLQRMLECGMISQEECDAATKAPIVLNRGTTEKDTTGSYAVMWCHKELDELSAELPEYTGGISVVSSMLLPLQQYMEKAVEDALITIEKPGYLPAAWVAGQSPEEVEATRKSFARMRRPKGMKIRGEDNDLKDVLQCCVLVVDTRRNQRGRVLAMVGGRSVSDGIDRWQGKVRPGRASAPFLFCCACMPGGDDLHIVARSTEVTGKRIGYDVVSSFYKSLELPIELPPREQELYLYNGLFQIRRLDLARLLFCMQNEGRAYRLSLISSIWNHSREMVYLNEPEKAPEYFRRQSATAVSTLPPFQVAEGKPVIMNEALPEGSGHWTMIYRNKAVCTFVWMGFDDPAHPLASARELKPLLSRVSMNLAREVFDKARELLRAQNDSASKTQKNTTP